MDKKLIIGLVYLKDDNWIGGTYYIQNIVHAFKLLPESQQPLLKVYCYSLREFEELKNITGYTSLVPVVIIYSNFFIRALNSIFIRVFQKYMFLPHLDSEVDILFPAGNKKFFRNFKNSVFWIPDFQEYHYPEFFSEDEIKSRRATHDEIVKNNSPLILSSHVAENDFRVYYPRAQNRVYVVPFAVTIPSVSSINFEDLKGKYGIHGRFFISSNQFWKHKNHLLVIKAVQELKKRDINVCLLFTGKPFDNRNPDYYAGLEKYVNDHRLATEIKFLGFIDRTDQLALMRNSIAIIQPSLFEGWSTVVEDAKALNHPILVSDIPVHREQLGKDFGYYFAPDDHDRLAELMETLMAEKNEVEWNYQRSILNFANALSDSMNEICETLDFK